MPLTVADASAMVGVLSSPEIYRPGGGQLPTLEGLTTFYAAQTVGPSPDGSQEWLNWVVLVQGDEPVGYVQASRPVGGASAEIAWVIGVPWQGQGYATAVGAPADRGVEELTACIHPANVPSVGVARRVGLHETDRMVDGEICWMGRTGA